MRKARENEIKEGRERGGNRLEIREKRGDGRGNKKKMNKQIKKIKKKLTYSKTENKQAKNNHNKK